MATGAYAAIAAYSGTGTQGLAVTNTLEEEDGDKRSVFWNKTDTDQQILYGSNILEIPTSSSNKQGSWGGSQTFSVNPEVDCIGDIHLALNIDFNVPESSISDDIIPRTITTLLQKPSNPDHKFLDNLEPVGYSLRGTKEGDTEPASSIVGYQQGFKKDESLSYDLNGTPGAYSQNGYPNRGEGSDEYWMELPAQRTILKGARTYYPIDGSEPPAASVIYPAEDPRYIDLDVVSPIALTQTGYLSKSDDVHMTSVGSKKDRPHDSSGYVLEGFNNWINTSLIKTYGDEHLNPKLPQGNGVIGHPPGRYPGVLSQEDANEIRHTGNEFLSLNEDGAFEIYTSKGDVASDLFKTYLDNNHADNLVNYYNDNNDSSHPLLTLSETSGLTDGANIAVANETFSVREAIADNADFNGECVVVSEDGSTMAVGQGFTTSRIGLDYNRVVDLPQGGKWDTVQESYAPGTWLGISTSEQYFVPGAGLGTGWDATAQVPGAIGYYLKKNSNQNTVFDTAQHMGKVRVYKKIGGTWTSSGILEPPRYTLTPPVRTGVVTPIVPGPQGGYANGDTMFTSPSTQGEAVKWTGTCNHNSIATEISERVQYDADDGLPYPLPSAANGGIFSTSNYSGFTDGGLHGFTNNKYISINSDGSRIVVAESNKNSGAPYNGWSGTFDYGKDSSGVVGWQYINEGYVGRYSRADMDYKGIPGAWDISLSGDGNSLASLDLRALAGNTLNDRTGCAPIELINYNIWRLGGTQDLDHFNPGDYDENDWAKSVASLDPSDTRNIENPKNWQWAWFITEYGPRNRWDYNYDVTRNTSIPSHSLSQSWARASLERILDSKTVPYSDFIRMRPRISHRILRTPETTSASLWTSGLGHVGEFSGAAGVYPALYEGPREYKAARSGYMQSISFKDHGIAPSNPYEPATHHKEEFDNARNAINNANTSNKPSDEYQALSDRTVYYPYTQSYLAEPESYDTFSEATFQSNHFDYFKEATFPGGPSSPYVPHPCNVWIRNWDPTNHGPNQDNIGGIGYNITDRINGWINHKVDYVGDIGLFGRGDKDIWHQYIYRKWMNFNEALIQHRATFYGATGYTYSTGIIPNGDTPNGFPLPKNYNSPHSLETPGDILGDLINLYSGYDPAEGYYGQTNGQWPSKTDVHDMPVNENYVRNSALWTTGDTTNGPLQDLDWKIPEIINLYIRNTYVAGEPERWAAKSVKMSSNGNRIAYITDAPTPVDRRTLPIETYSTHQGALGGTITDNPSWPVPANCEVRIIEKNSSGKWVYMNHSSGDMYSGLTIPTGHEAIDITMSSDGSTVAVYSKRPNLYPKWAWEEVLRLENGRSWENDISISNVGAVSKILGNYSPFFPNEATRELAKITGHTTPGGGDLFGKSVSICRAANEDGSGYPDPTQPEVTGRWRAAIGAPLNNANGTHSGIVEIWKCDDLNQATTWQSYQVQTPTTEQPVSGVPFRITGAHGSAHCGSSVAINKNGDVLAVGEPGYASNMGRIRVFKLSAAEEWIDITTYHTGQASMPAPGQYGSSSSNSGGATRGAHSVGVNILGGTNSRTGSTVAIAGNNQLGNLIFSGEPNLNQVRIFNEGGLSSRTFGDDSGWAHWNDYGILKGPVGSGYGFSVAVASNSHSTNTWGIAMAVGAPFAHTPKLSEGSQYYDPNPIGTPSWYYHDAIRDDSNYPQGGASDPDWLPGDTRYNENTGFVTVYMPAYRRMNGSEAWYSYAGDWKYASDSSGDGGGGGGAIRSQNSINLNGTQAGEKFGSSVAMGMNGDIVVVGSPDYNGSYAGSGRVTVWRVGRQESADAADVQNFMHYSTLLYTIDGLAGNEHIGRSVTLASRTYMEYNLRWVVKASQNNSVIGIAGDGVNGAGISPGAGAPGIVRFYKENTTPDLSGHVGPLIRIGEDVSGEPWDGLGSGVQLLGGEGLGGNMSMSEDGYHTIAGSSEDYVLHFKGNDIATAAWEGANLSPWSNARSTSVYQCTVKSSSISGGGNKYYLNGGDLNSSDEIESPDITIIDGNIYCFVWPKSTAHAVSVVSHPLRFSITPDGTHNGGIEYIPLNTTNTSVSSLGGIHVDPPGIVGIFPSSHPIPGTDFPNGTGHTIIRATKSMPTLYYYCEHHPGMGGRVSIQRAVPWIEPIQEDGLDVYDSYINDGLNDLTRGVGEPAITLHKIVNGSWTSVETLYPEGYYNTGFKHRAINTYDEGGNFAWNWRIRGGYINKHWEHPPLKYSLSLNSSGTRLLVGSPMTIPEDPGPKTITFNVTAQLSHSGAPRQVFKINNQFQPNFELVKSNTYIFNFISSTDSQTSEHPIRFSTTPDGTHNSGIEYTTGVNIDLVTQSSTTQSGGGSPGGGTFSGATTIQISGDTPILYYYSENVKNAGGRITVVDRTSKYTSNYYRHEHEEGAAHRGHQGQRDNEYIIPMGEALVYDWNPDSNKLILKNKINKSDNYTHVPYSRGHNISDYSAEVVDEESGSIPYYATDSLGDIKYPSNFSGASTIKVRINQSDTAPQNLYEGGKVTDTGYRFGTSVSISGNGSTICVGAPDAIVRGIPTTRPVVSGVSEIIDTFTFVDTPAPTPGPKKQPGKVFAKLSDVFNLINVAQKRSNYDITDFTNLPPIGEPIRWTKQFKEVPDGAISPPQLSEYDNVHWASSNLKSKVNFPLSKIINRIEFKIGTQIWQALDQDDISAINATELSESSYRRLGLQTHGFLRSDGTRESTTIDNWIPGKSYQAVIPLPVLTKTVGSQLENFTQNTEDGYLACLARDQEIKVKVYYSNFEDVWDVNNVHATKGYTAPIYNKDNKQRGTGQYITNAPLLWKPYANLTSKLYGQHIIMTKDEREHLKNIKDVIPKKVKTSQSINQVFPVELYPTTKILIDLDSFSLYSSHLIITSTFPGFTDKTKIPVLRSAELFLNSDSFSGRMDASILKGITNKSLGLYSNEFNIDNLDISAGSEYYVFPLASRAFGGSSVPLDRFDNIRLELNYTAPGLTDFGMNISEKAKINVTCRGEMLVTYKGGVSTIKLY